MRAVTFEHFGEIPGVRDVRDPECPADGAIVRIQATGLCRSDWHAWLGHDDTVRLPHVPGHEMAGVVEDVGTDVRGWRVGDRVTAPFVNACGLCEECRAGHEEVCLDQRQPGFTHWGSFAEYMVVHRADVNLVALPHSLTSIAGAILGCRFGTAYRAVRIQGAMRPGQWIGVHGRGGVGLSAVMIAVALGARVAAVDVSSAALAAAGDLGAEVLLNASDRQLSGKGLTAALHEATAGGVHVSVNALGSAMSFVGSLASLRPRGRHVQVGLMTPGQAQPELPMDRVIAQELVVAGSHGLGARHYPALLRFVDEVDMSLERLVARVIRVDAAGAELATMGSEVGIGGMTVIVIDADSFNWHGLTPVRLN